MHRAISGDLSFLILDDKGPSFIVNRYRVGTFFNGALHLHPFEAMYLFLKGKIRPENDAYSDTATLMRRLLGSGTDLDMFLVFMELKERGLRVRRDGPVLRVGSTEVVVQKESSTVDMHFLIEHSPCIVAAIDGDGDITFFSSSVEEPAGSNSFSTDAGGCTELFDGRLLCDPGSVPPWFGEPVGGLKLLNEEESAFVSGKCTKDQDLVFRDLVERGMIVKSGFKYGASFRAYRSSIEEHADYLIHMTGDRDEFYRISRAVRVAHAVRKEMLFAYVRPGKISYMKLMRLRDIGSYFSTAGP
ncbi:hypothetical protein GCM10007108_01630 [Thermogymnomonas acidicola]|uniref:tRNA intron endonuclease catalytic domain-containing protein n=1 Tax=Thermogymnomonas acidicola TaxID=399579 RepID=A0AA37F8W6_9ARCH|nr:tRNA-intron lyase [Thermogymnomonas acidicola]GGM67230.1 hypothetical protein GCM10007108_01630 [Thermogymnomonas acidicola]